MFDLVFLFTGLCGFALDQPQPQYGRAEALDVALVQAPQHVAMLVVRGDLIDPDVTTLEPSAVCGDHRAFDLDNKLVRLRKPHASRDREITWTPLAGEPKCPQRDGSARSYGWVAPMNRITPGEGRIVAHYRRPLRIPPPELRAVVQLEGGRLSAQGFARDSCQRVIRWKFDREWWRSKIETALGDPVEVRQRRSGDVVLELVDLTLLTVDRVVLKPAADGDSLLVEVFNTAKVDVCPSGPLSIEPVDRNAHFLHLYDLLPENTVRSIPEVAGFCRDAPDDPPVAGRCTEACFPRRQPLPTEACVEQVKGLGILAKLKPEKAPGNPQCPGADMSQP